MISNNVLGIVFANVHDDLIPELTDKRSMASIPFGGRYRLIDFSLSNLVNAGIDKVGIITKENYQSLMDHLGSGKPWDLDRKNGGIFILPPYSTNRNGIFKGHIDALAGVMTFLTRSNEEYACLCDSDVVSNIDLKRIIDMHKSTGADITVAYKNGKLPNSHKDILVLDTDADGRIIDCDTPEKADGDVNFSLDIYVMRRELLIELITAANKRSLVSFSKDIFIPNLKNYKMYGCEVTEYAEVIDSTESYVKISNGLLNSENRHRLFNAGRPVYTKVRDDMPTRYGINSSASNSLIADGCVIEGTVKNSVLFRGVTVEEGAVVENCIIMQGTKIGKNCNLKYVTLDKAATVSPDMSIMGTPAKNIFIGKGKNV